MDSFCITPHKSILNGFSEFHLKILVVILIYVCVWVVVFSSFKSLTLCPLSRTAFLSPTQFDLWPMTFQGERNSQQSLKFLNNVPKGHQPRALPFEVHAFLIFKVLDFHMFLSHTKQTKKMFIIYILHFFILQPQVPFPAKVAKLIFDVFWASMLTASPVESSMTYLPLVSTISLTMQFKRRKKNMNNVNNNL